MTNLPRPLTALGTNNETTLIRSEPQSSRVYITIHNPTTVYSARLAAVPSTTDQVTSITYNSGSGTHTNILSDQTLWVGTSAGAYDLGMARIRNLTGIGATSGTFEISEESEIDWASGAYLTVKDEFAIWPRHIRLDGTTPYMDYDVAYTDQNSYCDSIPVMGQHRVAWLDGSGSVTLTFDGSDSWALNNSITDYAWVFTDADSFTGETTATPTATYIEPGVYRVSLTVTNDDAATFTSYRYIFILAGTEFWSGVSASVMALQAAHIDSISGDYENGGWSANITLYDDASTAVIRDRALVIIHSRDSYGSYEGSIGFLNDSENILFIGWIAGETIHRAPDNEYGEVSFTIEGPQYWLGRIPAFPVGLKDRTTTPTKWTRFQGLTAKATVWHLLHWRTTITRCCDVYPLDNAYRAARIEAPGGQTLWEQLKYIESSTVLAEPCADRYARLFNQVNQQLLDDTARGNVPECFMLDEQDISGDVDIERRIVNEASIVDLSGVSFDGTNPSPFFSLSPGRVFRRYGAAPIVLDQLVLYDQDTTNTLCGLYAGWQNNEYPRVSMLLGSNQRFVDIAPYQYWLYNIAIADTPRNIVKAFRLIPRRVSFEYENESSFILTRADFEPESFAQLAITGDTPTVIPPDPPPPPPPPEPPPDPPPTNEAQAMWIIHSNPAATPPLAVIYEVLDDFDAPVYTALTPPASLYIDELYSGSYSRSQDALILVGHATQTPTSPGWGGGAASVTIRVTTPMATPSWSIAGVNGVTEAPYAGDVVEDSVVNFHDGTIVTGTPYPRYSRIGNSHSLKISGNGATNTNYKYLVSLSPQYNGASYGIASGRLNQDTGFGRLVCSPQSPSLACSYLYVGTNYDTVSGVIGPMPDSTNGPPATANTYMALDGTGTTYAYQTLGIEAGSPTYFYCIRRTIATNALNIVRIAALYSGFPNGADAGFVEVHTLDETSTGDFNCYWSNTYAAANYHNVIVNTTTPRLYYFDGTWHKMTGTIPLGFAHYLQRSGGVGLLWIASSTVTNGNEFARYTTDISGGTWVAMTGNMWSGAGQIITSGNLLIVDSWLSF